MYRGRVPGLGDNFMGAPINHATSVVVRNTGAINNQFILLATGNCSSDHSLDSRYS